MNVGIIPRPHRRNHRQNHPDHDALDDPLDLARRLYYAMETGELINQMSIYAPLMPEGSVAVFNVCLSSLPFESCQNWGIDLIIVIYLMILFK